MLIKLSAKDEVTSALYPKHDTGILDLGFKLPGPEKLGVMGPSVLWVAIETMQNDDINIATLVAIQGRNPFQFDGRERGVSCFGHLRDAIALWQWAIWP